MTAPKAKPPFLDLREALDLLGAGDLRRDIAAACATEIGGANTTPGIRARDRLLDVAAIFAAKGHEYPEAILLADKALSDADLDASTMFPTPKPPPAKRSRDARIADRTNRRSW